MRQIMCLAGIVNRDSLFIFADIAKEREKYLLFDGRNKCTISSICYEYGITPIDSNTLCDNMSENDKIQIWLYVDMLCNTWITSGVVSEYEHILNLYGKLLRKKSRIQIKLVKKGDDVVCCESISPLLRDLSRNANEKWSSYKRFAEDIIGKEGTCVALYKMPYVVRMPWKSEITMELAKKVHEFLRFVDARLTGYTGVENLKIFCGNRCWKERDYEVLLAQLRGEDVSERDQVFSLRGVVDSLAKQGYPVQAVDEKTELSSLDRLFEDMVQFYFPFMHELTIDEEKTNLQEIRFFNEQHDCIDTINELERKVVRCDKGDIVYYTAGCGETILIINAYGVKIEAWLPLINRLSSKYRVIVSEIRGLLNSEIPLLSSNSRMGLYDQIDDFRLILDNEKLDTFHLISWCSGAKQAVLLGNIPEYHVLSQTIIAGEFAPYAGSKLHHSKFRESVQEIYALIADNDRVFDFYMNIINKNIFTANVPYRSYISEKHDVDVADYLFMIIPDEYRPMILSPFTSKEKMYNFLSMCVEYYKHTVEEELKNLKSPLLLLSAENDLTAHPAQSAWAANVRQGTIHVCLPHATHMMIADRCDDIMKELLPHLEQNFNNKDSKMRTII